MTTRTALLEGVAVNDGVWRRKVVPWLLSIFLALGPVTWLPGLPRSVFRPLQYAVIVVALGIVFSTELLAGRRPFPRGLLGPWGFGILAVLWIPGVAQAISLNEAIRFILDLGSYCLLLWCFYCVARESDIVWSVFRRAFVIIVILGVLALVNHHPSAGFWMPGDRWRESEFSGFGLTSTGWSVGLAFFMPMSALWCIATPRRAALWEGFALVAALSIVGTQFLARGRAGLVVSLFVIAALALQRFSRQHGIVIVVALVVAAVLPCLSQNCLEDLRHAVLGQTEVPLVVVCNIDQSSTKRLTVNVLAVGEIAENPVLGQGLRQVLPQIAGARSIEIHNLWLKWAVYTGILAPLWLLAMTASLLYGAMRLRGSRVLADSERNGAMLLVLVVAAGLLMSLTEPQVPFGKNVSLIWWAAAGTLAGLAARCSSQRHADHA